MVQELVPNQRIVLRGENGTVVAQDTMTFRESGEHTEVTYTADFTFKGHRQTHRPLIRPAFTRLGNQAQSGMAAALAQL